MVLPDFLMRDGDGSIHLTGHRVGLHHLLFFYNEGYSPEMLLEQYPTLDLASIHKTIAFYLENRAEIDKYCAAQEAEVEKLRAASPSDPQLTELRRRLEARKSAQAT